MAVAQDHEVVGVPHISKIRLTAVPPPALIREGKAGVSLHVLIQFMEVVFCLSRNWNLPGFG
jgi:hypothetical protein